MASLKFMLTAVAILCAVWTSTAHAKSMNGCSPQGWVKLPPGPMLREWRPVPSAAYVALRGEANRWALRELREKSYRALGAADMVKFRARQRADGMPFFVRGVGYNLNNGTFTIKESEGAILVMHESLGSAAIKLRCQPLLVFLNGPPVDVYVNAGMDR